MPVRLPISERSRSLNSTFLGGGRGRVIFRAEEARVSIRPAAGAD